MAWLLTARAIDNVPSFVDGYSCQRASVARPTMASHWRACVPCTTEHMILLLFALSFIGVRSARRTSRLITSDTGVLHDIGTPNCFWPAISHSLAY